MDGCIPFGKKCFGRRVPPTPAQNRLLAALPAEVYERLTPHLQPVRLALGGVLYESGEQLQHIYFPTDSIVSLLCELDDGATVETAMAGNEGLVGIAMLMGGKTTPNRAVVKSAGSAFRIRADILVREFENTGALQNLLLRYTQALMTQTAQTAVCNWHHTIEQRLCRGLLLSLDRLPSNELTMTHEVIANTLGARREGVTGAAGRLQAAGLIKYSRGKITVLDRPKLEEQVCECYGVVKRESDRLLPNDAADGSCFPHAPAKRTFVRFPTAAYGPAMLRSA